MSTVRKVLYSSRFEKSFGYLPLRIRELALKKDKLFREDPFHSSLETHKLSGKFKGTWAYSVNKDFRVHFYFLNEETVIYVNIGTHEIYKKFK